MQMQFVAFFLSVAVILTLINIHYTIRTQDRDLELSHLSAISINPRDREELTKLHSHRFKVVNATDIAEYLLQKYSTLAPSFAESLNVTFRPTSSQPFFYIHLRKTGGSTVRNAVNKASKKKGWDKLNRYIPCVTWSCLPSDVPPDKEKWNSTEVYASHVNYVQAEHLVEEVQESRRIVNSLKRSGSSNGSKKMVMGEDDLALPSAPPFSCMLTIRPTVERVVSCWNYRMVEKKAKGKKQKTAKELTPEEWDALLPISFSRENEGCNNEMVRGFGTNYRNETSINTMRIKNDDSKNSLDAVRELELIMVRLSYCVVTVMDRCEESKVVVSHYMPWLGDSYQCDPSRAMNRGIYGNATPQQLPDVSSVILRHNAMDEYLFRFAEELFAQQLLIGRQATKAL